LSLIFPAGNFSGRGRFIGLAWSGIPFAVLEVGDHAVGSQVCVLMETHGDQVVTVQGFFKRLNG
jgi:hypothetical protein